MIDFHTHSSISDGGLSPTELISLASKKGLKYIALTDHNKIKGLPEAAKIAAQYGINFKNGIVASIESSWLNDKVNKGSIIATF